MTRKLIANARDSDIPGICYTMMFEGEPMIQVGWYNDPPDGFPPEDRIHLLIRPRNEPMRGFVMTVGEAECIIAGLEMAIERMKESDNKKANDQSGDP